MSTELPTFLLWNSEFSLIICRIHQTALHPSKLASHLESHLSRQAIEKIDLTAYSILPLQESFENIKKNEPISPIQGLAPPQSAFQCLFSACDFRSTSQKQLAKHLRSHDIYGKDQERYISTCDIQILDQSRYIFLVDPDLPPPITTLRAPPRSLTPTNSRLLDDFFTRHYRTQAESSSSRVFRVLGDSSEANSFLNEVQYPRFLADRDLEVLETLFSLQSDENQKTTLLFDAILYLIVQGQNRIRQTSSQALMALNAFSRGQEHAANTRKFRPLQSPKSLQIYANVFRALIIFLLNTFQFQGESPRYEGPASMQNLWTPRPIDLEFLETLENALNQARPRDLSVARVLPRATWQDNLDSDSDLGSEVENNEDPVPITQPIGQFSPRDIQTVAKHLQEFCMSLMQRPLGNYFEDPLYAFLACYSRDYAKGCFKWINVISHIYSAIIKTFQFILLNYTHQNLSPDQPMAKEITAFMFNHFTVQSESPLGMVLDHRKFALFLNRNSSALGLVTLIDAHTLLYRQKSISQRSLQSFLHQTLKNLALEFTNDLFLQFHFFQEIWPSISLQESARFEEFANSTLGFSFLLNLQNARYYAEFLIRKIMTSELQATWFQKIQTEQGVKLKIIPKQAYSYLGQVSRFQKTLLALCHMTSGAPARGTEINQVLLQNSAITTRHLFLDPKSAQFLIRLAYSKTFTRTGQERNAVRVLPQVLSEILLAFLLVIRPFLGFLTLDLEQAPTGLEHLWVDYSTSRVISSKALSDTMKRLSLENLGFSIGLSSWRHIAQAFIRYVIYIYIYLSIYRSISFY